MRGRGLAERLLPATRWLRGYGRGTLAADLRAGATVAVLVVPQSMAYAALAGLPAVTGLYAAMVSLVVYAALGTSRHASIAPVAIDSLLVATAVAPLADGNPSRYVALAGLLAVLTGLVQVAAGLLRLGVLVSFLSVPVIAGFTAAAALTIAASQLKALLGVTPEGLPTSTFVDTLVGLVPVVDTTNLPTLAVGLGAVAALVLLRRYLPAVPGPLVVIAGALLVVTLADLQDVGVAVLGEVPSGLPTPDLPTWDMALVRDLLPAALAIALISYVETISTGSAFARRTRSRIEPNQEAIAVGAANITAGVFRGFAVAGGFSRGAVNFSAGARTPMSGVIAAGGVALSVLFLPPVLSLLPTVALAAVILVAVASLVDVSGALAVGRIRRSDLAALVITFVATLVLGVASGLAVGVAFSVAVFLRRTARSHLVELGRIPGTRLFRNVARQSVLLDPAVVVLRLDSPLYFGNSRAVADEVADLVADRTTLRYLVLDASGVNSIDYTGADALADLERGLDEAGVELHVATVRGAVRDVLERTRLWDELQGGGRVHPAVAEAVATFDLAADSPIRPPVSSLVPRDPDQAP